MRDPRRLLAGIVLGLASTLTLSACGGGGNGVVDGITTNDHDGYAGTLLDQPYRVPALSLTDTDGKPVELSKDPKSQLDVVFFGYTNCPDICQAVMANIASAYQRLDESDQRRTKVWFVTTDPARDTASVLRSYLDRYNPDFQGATGPLSRIIALGKPLGIFVAKGKKLPSGGYEVDHTTSILGLRGGVAPMVWTNGLSPKALADDIHKFLEESA